MSSTATRHDRPLDPPVAGTTLAPPPKLRRRPVLMAAAVAAICIGALLAAWAWTATSSTQDVLVARQTIPRGSIITAGELERVHLSADPALKPVPASDLNQVVGQRAALDIASGAMLTPGSYASTVVPGAGQSVVGVDLKPGQLPGLALNDGDPVRVVVTPGQGNAAPSGVPLFTEAQVVGETRDQSGNFVVDLVVASQDAPVLAARLATGNVAIVLDSRAN